MGKRSGEIDLGVRFHDSKALDLDVADALGAEAVEADAVFFRVHQLGHSGGSALPTQGVALG
jgi:hypothetical protein